MLTLVKLKYFEITLLNQTYIYTCIFQVYFIDSIKTTLLFIDFFFILNKPYDCTCSPEENTWI